MADQTISSLAVMFSGDVGPLAGSLSSGVTGLRSFRSAVGDVDASLARMGATAGRSSLGKLTSGVGDAIGTIVRMTGVAGLAAGAVGSLFALGKGFHLAADLEQAQVALATMTGSADTAKSVLKQLTDFAAATPFRLPELVDASKQLIAFGIGTKELLPDLTMLGDIASGVGAPLGSIAQAFGRVAVAGRVTGEVMMRLQEQGVPITSALAKQFGVPQAAIQKMVEEGKVGFAQFQQALGSLTGPGGQFAGMMAKQSQTVAGLMSTLGDTVDMTLARVATTIIDTFNIRGGIKLLTSGLDTAGNAVVGLVQTAAPYLQSFGLAIASAFSSVYTFAVPIVEAVAAGVRSAWGPVSTFLAQHADVIRGALGGMGAALASLGLPSLFGAVGAAVSLAAGAVGTLAGVLLSPVAGAITLGAAVGVLVEQFGLVGKASALVSEAAAYVGQNWQWMVGVAATAGAGIYSVAAGAFMAVAQVTSAVWTAVAGVVGWAWDTITSIASAAASALAGEFGGISVNTQGLANAFTVSTAIAGYTLSHLGDVAKLAAVTVAANLAELVGQVQWAFTTAAPAYIVWFATNAIGVLGSFYQSAKDTFTNVVGAIGSTLGNLPAIIRGSVNLSDIWKDVGTSFAVSFSALPQIADRQMGAVEQTLRGAQTDLAKGMAGGMADAVAKQQADAVAAAKKVTDAISSTFSSAKPAELAKPTVKAPDPVSVKPTLDPSSLSLGITPEIKHPKALLAGSAEAAAATYDAGHVTPSVMGAVPKSVAPATSSMASMLPPVPTPAPAPIQTPALAAVSATPPSPTPMPSPAPASTPAPAPALTMTAPAPSPTANAADAVRQAMKNWQAAAQQARASDGVGGVQHRSDQLAAQQAMAQLRAAQAQRDAAGKTVVATTAPQHGTPIAGVTHHDAPDTGDGTTLADYLKTRPDLARDMATDRLKPPEHARVQYATTARPELSDAMQQADGTYRVRSGSTGMSAVVDADAAARLGSEARSAAGNANPNGMYAASADDFAKWKASRDAAMASATSPVKPPRPEPKPTSPGVDATRREASTAAASKQLNEQTKGTGLLAKIETNTRSQTVTVVTM